MGERYRGYSEREVTVRLFEINAEKGHGGPSKNRTTKTPHLHGQL
jgi:hypothetical protein